MSDFMPPLSGIVGNLCLRGKAKLLLMEEAVLYKIDVKLCTCKLNE